MAEQQLMTGSVGSILDTIGETPIVRLNHVTEGIEMIEDAATEAGRSFDRDHYGVLIPYVPPGLDLPTEAVERVSVRRPDARPDEVVATSHDALHDMIDAYIAVGATKFVCFPFAEPGDWHAELEQLAPILEKQT